MNQQRSCIEADTLGLEENFDIFEFNDMIIQELRDELSKQKQQASPSCSKVSLT